MYAVSCSKTVDSVVESEHPRMDAIRGARRGWIRAGAGLSTSGLGLQTRTQTQDAKTKKRITIITIQPMNWGRRSLLGCNENYCKARS